MSNVLGDGSSDTSMTDAALGDALTGGDGSFGATGGSDLGSMFSSIGQAFAGGGANPAATPTGTVDAIQQATDPTGSIGAQTAITGGTGGGNAPTQSQTQNPQGPQGGGQGGQDQFAPSSAVDQLKKALQGLRQQQRQNPYAFPGGPGNAAAGQNSPMLNRAGRIPTDQVPDKPAQPDDPNAPSQYASNMEFSNDNPPPPQPPAGIDPADAVRAGLRSNAPDTSGQFKLPGAANENAPSENFPAYLKNLREGGGAAAPEVPPQAAPSAPPTLDLGQDAGGGGLGGLAALARIMGLGPAGLGAAIAMKPTPAETGELPYGYGGSPDQPARPVTPTPTAPQLPKSEVLREGEGGPATTTAPVTGKKVETVDPKTKKPVDPKTGDPLPTKKGPLPTKTGHYEPATGDARDKTWHPDGVSRMMRDVSGVSTGVPQGLGEIARMAMPLLMMAMGGMGGGGRHGGRFGGRGFGGMGHPGGRGMWPYHHPNFGWGMHGFHPGGGRRPMHPVHFREMGGGGGPMSYAGGGGGTGNPALDAILQGMGGGQQGQQQQGNRGQSGFGQPRGGGLSGGADDAFKNSGLGGNPLINTLVGQESGGGQNIVSRTDKDSRGLTLAQGGNPDEISSGYFQIQNHPGGTWQTYGRQAGIDLAKYPTPRSAPIDVQWKVASLIPIGQWGPDTQERMRQAGFSYNPNTPLGQVAQANGGVKLATAPGTTPTGGVKGPNPQGNPATTQQGPEGLVAAQ